MIDDKFIKEVIFLGVGKIDDYYEMYAALMPFINELANLFTIVFFKICFSRLISGSKTQLIALLLFLCGYFSLFQL